jgi:rubrerythrin
MNLKKTLTKLYMTEMLRTPRGQAHLLNQIAEAEESGEARVFDDALAHVDDPKLQKMIELHREDEIRHGLLFRECLARTGVDPGPVPADLKALDRIDRKMGGFFERDIKDGYGVMQAYLILQVIEERAIEQFSMVEPVFRKYDAKTADVFKEVAADEQRHLKYCHAITKRYAPDQTTLERELGRLRQLEAEAHLETEQANTRYAFEHDLLTPGFPRWLWRNVTRFGERRSVLPLTQFHRAALALA